MEPFHIPATNPCKAELMRTELLIQAHKKQLAQHVKQLCNMDLNIYVYTFATHHHTGTIKHS